MEANKWREIDKERIFLLITALFVVLVTDFVIFIRESSRPRSNPGVQTIRTMLLKNQEADFTEVKPCRSH